MILILSQDPDAVRAIARTQANVRTAIFGSARSAFRPAQPLARDENLYVVAVDATRGADWSPVLGDEASRTYWTATQAMQVLAPVLPSNYAGNVYITATKVANPMSTVTFASTFKTQLLSTRRNAGSVYGQTSAAVGPLPGPYDARWIEAQAA